MGTDKMALNGFFRSYLPNLGVYIDFGLVCQAKRLVTLNLSSREMLSSGLKSFVGVVRCQNAAFSHQTFSQVKAKKKELLSIQTSHEFLRAVKHKGREVSCTDAFSTDDFINSLCY